MYLNQLLTALCLFALSGSVLAQTKQSEPAWTQAPLLITAPSKGEQRTQALLRGENLDATELWVHPPFKTQVSQPYLSTKTEAGFALKTQGIGNYHLITANQAGRSAATAYYFSNPGPVPRQLLQTNWSELVIKPLALPREHNQYQSDSRWRFQVNYQTKPLANTKVQLDTSNGSHQTLLTDAQGQFDLVFPNDFQDKVASPHCYTPRAWYATWTARICTICGECTACWFRKCLQL